jgi:hypothetical protein
VAFSLDTFFWPSKRKYRGCRSANRRQIKIRGSETIKTRVFKLQHASDYATDALHFVQHILFGAPYRVVAAPSTVGFERICPQGRGRDAARFSRGWEALRKTPLKPGGAQD